MSEPQTVSCCVQGEQSIRPCASGGAQPTLPHKRSPCGHEQSWGDGEHKNLTADVMLGREGFLLELPAESSGTV